jgi:small subunit ribosomal protein S19
MANEKQEITTKKIFKYKGKTIEELKEFEVREFAKLLPSRRRRTILRNFQKIESFIIRAKKKISKNKHIKTHQRNLVIVPQMVGMKIQVHNGREFVPFEVTGDMLGHVSGEFAITRVKPKHEKKGVGASKSSKTKAKK